MELEQKRALVARGFDQDTVNAYAYVQGKIAGDSMQHIADEIGIARSTLYEHVRRWEDAGLLSRIRHELLLPQIEDIRQEVDATLREWPMLIRQVRTIAKTAKFEDTRLKAIDWLHSHVVKPALDDRPDGSVRELNYVNSEQEFDPMAIPDAALTVIVEQPVPQVIQGRAKKG